MTKKINVIEIHGEGGCIMNCKGCPTAIRNQSLYAQTISDTVRESFLVLQDKVNELSIKTTIQYNIPIINLLDLELHIKKKLLQMVGFSNQMPETEQESQMIVDALYSLHSSMHYKYDFLTLLLAQKDNNMVFNDQNKVSNFLKMYLSFAKEKAYKSAGITVLRHMLDNYHYGSLGNEKEIVKKNLLEILDGFAFFDESSYDGKCLPGQLTRNQDYRLAFESNQMMFGFNKRVVSMHSNGRTANGIGIVNDRNEHVASETILNPNANPIFEVALYPKDIWLGHNPFHNLGSRSYFTVTHHDFQNYIKNVTQHDLNHGAINFSQLLSLVHKDKVLIE